MIRGVMQAVAPAVLPGEAADSRLASRLQIQQASFLRRLGDFDAASEIARDAAQRAAADNDALTEAMACAVWGEALWRQGDYAGARSASRAVRLKRWPGWLPPALRKATHRRQ